MLTKRQLLESYTTNEQMLKVLRGDSCIVSDVVRGSGTEPPYSQHTVRIRGVDRMRKARNQNMMTQIQQMMQDAENVIQSAPNSELRYILMLKFQDGMDWDEVGALLNKSGESCRKRAERWLKEEEQNNKPGN